MTGVSRSRYVAPVSRADNLAIGHSATQELDDGLTVTGAPIKGAKPLRIGGMVIPSAYTVTAHGGSLQHEVQLVVEVEDGQPVVTRATFDRAPGGASVSNASVRVPVERLVSLATQVLATYLDDDGNLRALLPETQADLDAADRVVRRPVDHERLQQVAAVWRRQRLTSPGSPADASARELFVSRSQFDRLRTAALAAGLLDPHEVPRRGAKNRSAR